MNILIRGYGISIAYKPKGGAVLVPEGIIKPVFWRLGLFVAFVRPFDGTSGGTKIKLSLPPTEKE